jgi:hypothetical protein
MSPDYRNDPPPLEVPQSPEDGLDLDPATRAQLKFIRRYEWLLTLVGAGFVLVLLAVLAGVGR